MYPHERSLVKQMEGKPFVLIGVNSDRSKEELKQVQEKEQITWRSFFDGGDAGGKIASTWKIKGWPTLFVIDHKGVMRHKWVGSPGNEKLDEAIQKLVAEAQKDKGGSK